MQDRYTKQPASDWDNFLIVCRDCGQSTRRSRAGKCQPCWEKEFSEGLDLAGIDGIIPKRLFPVITRRTK